MTDIPNEIVLKAAEAMVESAFARGHTSSTADMRAGLVAILTPAAIAVLKGEAVAVPREATNTMMDEAVDAGRNTPSLDWEESQRFGYQRFRAAWNAALAASPWAPKP